MAAIDTLTIVFEAEARKATADVQKLDDKIEDVGDSATKADKNLAEFEKEIKKTGDSSEKSASRFDVMTSKLLGIVAAAASAGAIFGGVVNRAAEIEQIANSANAIGESVENVDAFGRAMAAMGGDAQGARDSLTDMSESVGEALQDIESGRAKTFKALGVSLKGVDGQVVSPMEALMRLSDSVQNMSKQEAVFRIKELGITDNKTVEAVLKGRQELTRLIDKQKEYGTLTKEQVKQAKEFNETLGGFKETLRATGSSIFQAIMPALTGFIGAMQKGADWVRDNDTLVKGFFIGLAGLITLVYLPAMLSAAAATLVAIAPFIALGAAVGLLLAAFSLAYEDIMMFLEGGESVTGMLVNKFRPQVDAAKAAIDSFFGAIRSGWESVKGFWDKIANFGSGGLANLKASVNGWLQTSSDASSNPLASTTSNAISNSSTGGNENNVAVGTVTVNTQATDAQGVAAGVKDALAGQLKNLQTESASGAVA